MVRCSFGAPFFIFRAMNISLVEFDMVWENPVANRSFLEAHFKGLLEEEVDIIVLPEMFTTGFTMNAVAMAETMEGETVEWMKSQSRQYQAAIVGSIIIQEQGRYFNRCFFIQPNGSLEYYDKQHLFTIAEEHHSYSRGLENKVVEYKGWKIALMICYDLRFPALLRSALPFDLVIFVASWPSKRIDAWTTLLKARAIENQAYVIGVNRKGRDANGFHYCGHSIAFDPLGATLLQSMPEDGLTTISIDKIHLEETRRILPFLNDRDSITVG